ncbi:MAG: VWA domain-containing protein [Verrucomicrobiaceae bacterium]|nr:VWA domain-containing protein [Verrucomicrobiaceae bacterium]
MKLAGDIEFAWPWALVGLICIPFVAWWRGRRGKAPAVMFPTAFLLMNVARPARSWRGGIAMGLSLASLAAAMIGMARPQRVKSFDEDKTEGLAICLTVDVSLSMLTQDFFVGGVRSDRLTAAKRVMRDFIRGRTSDRIGIVAFAGAPYLPCPLTLDHEWLESNIERVQTGITGDGTAIGSGIASAAARLDKEKKVASKVIILLTDGANNSGRLSPQDAARAAATLGIRIYTIAIGTPGHHLIHTPDGRVINSGRQEFDEPTLIEVAKIGNGAFYKAQDLDALDRIFKTIDQLERTEVKVKKIIERDELFHWPVGLALLLLILAFLLHLVFLRTSPLPAAA